MPRVTKAEKKRRVNDVYKMLLVGCSRAEILQLATNQGWGVSDRQVDTYIKDARKKFTDVLDEDVTQYRAEALTRLHYLLQKAFQIQDYKTALAVQKEINSVLGLEAAKKLDHSGDVTITHNVPELPASILDRIMRHGDE